MHARAGPTRNKAVPVVVMRVMDHHKASRLNGEKFRGDCGVQKMETRTAPLLQ